MLTLLLFWRDIASNLSSNTVFKLQLKLHLVWNNNNSSEINNEDLSIENDIHEINQIRSIGYIRLFSNKDIIDTFSIMSSYLWKLMDNYASFYVKNIILTYNICYEDSILNILKLTNKFLDLIDNVHSKNKIEKNKKMLKLSN